MVQPPIDFNADSSDACFATPLDDYDPYRGAYGIEDTRQALIEARRDGMHFFCIIIDTEAKDYLPHMYGAANYTVIDEVRKLPLKVSDIYRRLTT